MNNHGIEMAVMSAEVERLNKELAELKEENLRLANYINEVEAEAEALCTEYEHDLNKAYIELEQSINFSDLIYHMKLDGVFTSEIEAYFEHFFHWYANRTEANELL